MARTPDGAALTRQHHGAQLALRAGMLSDLTRLWNTVDPLDLSNTIGRFAAGGAVLVRARHRDSAVLGGRYFRDFRIVEGVGRMALPDLADAPPVSVAAGTLRGAGLSGIINARRRGFSPQAAARQGLVKVSGSATTLTLNGGRDMILGSIREDPRALGWLRVTSGNPCAFCAMIASRGAVFSANSADFEAHDHDACEPEPFYEGSELPELNEQFLDQWNETRDLNSFRRLREGRA